VPIVEVDELMRAEVERLLAVGGAPAADDVGAGLACELRHHRTDGSGGAVREDAALLKSRQSVRVTAESTARTTPSERLHEMATVIVARRYWMARR
jgi:5'-3' exonuclease